MLQKLNISNIALIESLELEFDKNFNVLSGETGAGKSIIIDSLFLLLGQKYDKALLSYGQKVGFVEGVFDANDSCKIVLQELGFESDDTIIIKRKFDDKGKNEIKLNGQNCTTTMLKKIASTLLDIYGQNQHLTLNKPNAQLKLVTDYLGNSCASLLGQIASNYATLKDINKQIRDLGDGQGRLRELEVLKYQIDEIANANTKQGEEDGLVDRRKFILSAEKIKTALNTLAKILGGESGSVLSRLAECKVQYNHLKDLKGFDQIKQRLDATRLELVDIEDTLDSELKKLDFDQDDLDIIEKRLEVVRLIKRKYGDYNQCQKFLGEAQARFVLLSDADNVAASLCVAKQKIVKQLFDECKQLSVLRRKGAVELGQRIVCELNELGMQDSVFEIKFGDMPSLETCEEYFDSDGFDQVEFYLSTNLGQPPKPLSSIISGGELSRFMLCLKVIAATNEQIDTLIFDEIDTGISGITGQAVAKKLAKISRQKQVLCISHLPQIVAMADVNFLIQKTTLNEETHTSVERLKDDNVINEIARLTGGINISKQSTQTAKEMREWSVETKKYIQ